MEEQYKNREIDERFNDIKEMLERIEIQTLKTNGRVGELEKFRWMVYGALAIMTTIIIPIALVVIKNLRF